MTGSGSPLALAAWLRARDDDALRALLRARPVRESGVRDVFDLADALLQEVSVQAALEELDRPALAVLAASGMLGDEEPPAEAAVAERLGRPLAEILPIAAALEALALLERDDGRLAPRDPVTRMLRDWPARGLPAPEELVDGTPPALLEPVPIAELQAADRGGAERAFAATVAIGELLHSLEREPARRLQRGGIALPDWRRLLAATGAEGDDELGALLGLAESAGLAETSPDATRTTAGGAAWHGLPRVERWAALAAGWLAEVPDELREQLRARARARWGDRLGEYLEWLYPAGGDRVREGAAAAARAAELLGIASAAIPSRAGEALLAEDAAAAAAAMAGLFPPDVRQVYIQHDLSVIAPGPLAPDVDARLREVADVEAVGVASSYRITAASLTRALTTGLGVDEVRELLAEVSLTGVPQPLAYLLAETSARFGSIRVGALDGAGTEPGAHAYVRGEDPAIIGQLVIDQALAPLALRRTGEHRAVTRFDAEALYWSLVDARYPVVLEDADGVIRTVRRPPAISPPAAAAPDPVEALVVRLREAAAAQPLESGAAWNARQLELAIRSRLEVVVTVRMPDGAEVPYLLEPAALAGGRLRARDRRADIERTLPLSHIVEVMPAPAAD